MALFLQTRYGKVKGRFASELRRSYPEGLIELNSLPLPISRVQRRKNEALPPLRSRGMDIYFSADIETDGSIPGPYSILSFALVYAGAFDGETFYRPTAYDHRFYTELRPISDQFELEALSVNGLDRDNLIENGEDPSNAMTRAADWVRQISGSGEPVFVAYPLSFDWSWLYWYFVKFSLSGSPFGYSRCFDVKTAMAVKLGRTINGSGRNNVPEQLRSMNRHTHHALDDAIEQAEIFANLFEMEAPYAD